MDFRAGIRRRGERREPKQLRIEEPLDVLYPHDLQMYTTPPGSDITLSEFEDLAIERLQLLRILGNSTAKGDKLYTQEWKDAIMSDIRKQKLTNYIHLLDARDGENKLQARRADHISHFILRLAYCRSNELIGWFLAREEEWFRLKYMMLSTDAIKSFLDLNNLIYTPISSEEKDAIRSELYDSTAGVNNIDSVDFYKVPWTEVFSLIGDISVYVHHGFAYAPDSEIIVIILSAFSAKLSEALAYARTKISAFDDERLNDLLTNLHKIYTGRDYGVPDNKEYIDIEQLDIYAQNHYPICMRHMHETFRANHHMKHHVRLMYGLFLKGIGVTFEDAMRLWKEEFTKLIDESQFEKQYAYTIKHQYGKVGSMANYAPYSCIKVITDYVGPGQHHGCPFRHFDANNLKQKLITYGICNNDIKELLELVKNQHYQVACSKYFEYVHGQPPKNTIIHPNQYFEESRELSKKDTVNSTPTASRSRQSLGAPSTVDVFMNNMEF